MPTNDCLHSQQSIVSTPNKGLYQPPRKLYIQPNEVFAPSRDFSASRTKACLHHNKGLSPSQQRLTYTLKSIPKKDSLHPHKNLSLLSTKSCHHRNKCLHLPKQRFVSITTKACLHPNKVLHPSLQILISPQQNLVFMPTKIVSIQESLVSIPIKAYKKALSLCQQRLPPFPRKPCLHSNKGLQESLVSMPTKDFSTPNKRLSQPPTKTNIHPNKACLHS